MKLRHFLQYLAHNRDDSPLYIFDSTFDEDKHAKRILDDYEVPTYFDEDLLGLVGERRRPPYRCVLCDTIGMRGLLARGLTMEWRELAYLFVSLPRQGPMYP